MQTPLEASCSTRDHMVPLDDLMPRYGVPSRGFGGSYHVLWQSRLVRHAGARTPLAPLPGPALLCTTCATILGRRRDEPSNTPRGYTSASCADAKAARPALNSLLRHADRPLPAKGTGAQEGGMAEGRGGGGSPAGNVPTDGGRRRRICREDFVYSKVRWIPSGDARQGDACRIMPPRC